MNNQKYITQFICILLLIVGLIGNTFGQAVGINTDGSSPDNSSILDIKSTTKGILVPRMSTLQRDGLFLPALGLMVYDTDTKSFWYYNDNEWIDLSSAVISDVDNDTKIEVEKTPDQDTIRFTVNGIEIGKMDTKTFHLQAPDGSIFIGKDAGLADDGTNNYSTAVGYEALMHDATGWNNTAIGYKSLSSSDAGDNNTAVGSHAMQKTQYGDFNVGIGSGVLLENTSGSNNVGAGYHALVNNLNGKGNIAIGSKSLVTNTTGKRNVAIGSSALYNNTIKSNLVAVGDSALYYNGSVNNGGGYAENNTAVGTKSLYSNNDGSENTAMGYQSMYSNTTGRYNVAIGSESLFANTEGEVNTAIGLQTMLSNTSGEHNTAVGGGALSANSAGNNNTVMGTASSFVNNGTGENTTIGAYSGYYNSTGNSNTLLGYKADNRNTSGSNNTLLGHQAGHGSVSHSKSGSVMIGHEAGYNETNSDRLYIDNSNTTSPLIYGEFDNNKLRINGELEIGTAYTFPTNDGLTDQVLSTDGSGNITWENSVSGQWLLNSPNIYFNTGDVAIGKTVADYPLDVYSIGNTSQIKSIGLGSGDKTALSVYAVNANFVNASDSIIGIKASVGYNAHSTNIALLSSSSNNSDYAGVFDGNVAFRNRHSSNHQIMISPKATSSGDSTSLFFAEDNDGTYGMFFQYDGNTNTLNLHGKNNSTISTSHLTIRRDGGEVAIGNSEFADGYKLSVDGKVACEEILVDLSADWPDYVFESKYHLRPLSEVNIYIKDNGHLPGIPSAKKLEKEGLELGEMNRLLMEKIEELTLYLIEHEKKNKELEHRIMKLEQSNSTHNK